MDTAAQRPIPSVYPRTALFLVLGGYLLLIAASAIFYQLRVLYSDSAYYLFRIANEGNFHIEHGRYGAFASQVLPLLGVKLGAPLAIVACLYSISIPMFTGLWSTWICLRQRKNALVFATLILLLQTLSIRHSWFWPVSELLQGVIYLIMGFFYLQTDEKKWLPVAWLFLGLALLSHPAVAPLTAALLLAQYKQWNRWNLVLLLLACGLAFFLLPRSDYEKEKMAAFTNVDHMVHSALWGYLKLGIIKVYLLCMPLAAYVLYKRKDWVFRTVALGYTLAWLLLCAASEYQGNSAVMLENVLLPIPAFWLLAAAYVWPSPKTVHGFVLLTLLIFTGYTGYLGYSTYFPNTALRKQNLDLWTRAYPSSYFFEVMNENSLVANDKIMKNRLPVEYLMQSALDNDGNIRVVAPSSVFPEADPHTIYLGNDLPRYTRNELNSFYFIPGPENAPYVVLTP